METQETALIILASWGMAILAFAWKRIRTRGRVTDWLKNGMWVSGPTLFAMSCPYMVEPLKAGMTHQFGPPIFFIPLGTLCMITVFLAVDGMTLKIYQKRGTAFGSQTVRALYKAKNRIETQVIEQIPTPGEVCRLVLDQLCNAYRVSDKKNPPLPLPVVVAVTHQQQLSLAGTLGEKVDRKKWDEMLKTLGQNRRVLGNKPISVELLKKKCLAAPREGQSRLYWVCEFLKTNKINLLIPCVFVDGFYGALFLGKKSVAYEEDELELLERMAYYTALSVKKSSFQRATIPQPISA